jgi:hypothetical protein
MNILKSLHKVFFVTCFVVAAILFSLVVVPTHTETTKAQNGSWKLREIRVFNTMDGRFGTITSERYDASGGSVDIQISGDSASICPGGYEKVRFTWSFAGNITEVVSGGGVNASLAAGQVAKSQNCRTTLAASSFMEFSGPTHGSAKNLSSAEYQLLDPDRIFTPSRPRIYGAEFTQSGTGTVKINTHRFDPKKPWAYFEVSIGTPTKEGGGCVYYVYLYENTGGGSTGGNGGGGNSNFTIEYDTDRRGGDYKDFDLPQARIELCRDACANDSNCRAFTYVKPGGQGPNARCWLKSSVPSGEGGLSCCISGVKR